MFMGGGGSGGGILVGPVGSNYYSIITTDSSASVQADTFDVTPDGSCIIFSTQSINQIPSQSTLFAAQALYKLSNVTQINIIPWAATPTFNPPAGSYGSTQSVTISSTSAPVSIYYTTNGTTPTTASTLYTTPVSVAANLTLQAIAVGTGFGPSAVGSAVYTIT
jgi:hypothetical protein